MWLCLHLPNCALEAATRYLPAEDAPMAVVAAERGRRRVIAVNDVARQCGVAPGQWLTAARARAPALLALQHDPRAQDRLLRELAARCLTYSSHVHRPDPPPEPGAGRLLLEIGASLRLFGGRARLQEMLEENLAQAGHEVFLGAGRTPTLAMLRARAGAHGQRVTKTHRLPLVLLELPPATLESLTAAGLTTVGEVLALSRAAVGHRYGPDCLSYLDRLTGRAPDPRPALAWPQRFAVKLELSAEAIDTQALGFVLERLVTDLGAALRGADAAVVALHLTLEHAGRTPTRVNLGFTAPTRNPARITSLLATRLETLQLPAPVRALRLTSERFAAFTPNQLGLFEERNGDATAWHELLDRLQARLGTNATQQLQCHPDHRPERATQPVTVGTGAEYQPPTLPRPTWLLDKPEPLSAPPTLFSGPERIESGWWEADQRRDYYVGLDQAGRRVWVYREGRAPHRWFLHGLFA